MKLVIIEPLEVSKEKLLWMADRILGEDLEIVYYDTRVTDTDELIKRGKDADIIVVSNLPLNDEVINGCKNLKMISVAFAGVDHIDLKTCRERNIVVSNCPAYSTAAVSELTFGMILSLYRKINECDKSVRQGGTRTGLLGTELEGKKFGIIGTGSIGTRVADIAKAFGCSVLAYSRTKKDIDGIEYVDLKTLMKKSDIISIHVPLTDETRNLINKDNIALMKKNAILINIARGGVVDSNALAEALNSGSIAGAAVDVFENEPPIDNNHSLLKAKNLIAAPHIGFYTKEALEKRAKSVLQNVRSFLDGTPENVIK